MTVDGSNDDPTASAIVRAIGDTGPLNVDLLSDAAAADPDASDVLSLQNLDGTITTTDGRVLTLDVDYTVTGSVFELTAAGLAQFGDLGGTEDDTFTFNYEITDGSSSISNTLDVTVSGGNSPPTASAIIRAVDEDAPTFTVDLLIDAAAADADVADVLSVENVDPSVTTAIGLGLTLGTHYTVVGSTFTLTGAGFALFNFLAVGASDAFTISYDISDGTTAITNTLDITIDGTNDAPLAFAIVRAVDEDGPALTVDLLTDASALDPDFSDVLSVQNVDPSITTANGVTLTLGTHYTVAGSTFNLTAAGFALFSDLAAGEDDTFTLNYDISDGLADLSNTLDVTVNGTNGDPTAVAVVRVVDEDGPTLAVDLLTDAAASDPDASDVLTVENADPSITTTNGVTLTLGTHYTVAGSAFNLTAAGFALFNDLAAGEDDSFTLNYDISDGTSAISNTLDVTVNGSNDDPTAIAIVRAIGEAGPLNVDLLSDAAAADPDASDVLSVQNLDGTITTVDGRVLTLGVDYTVTGSVFELTAAGLAQFGDLADAEDDTFTVNYEVTDGTSAISNTLDVTVSGGNSPPTATAIVRAVDEDGPTLAVDLLTDAAAADADASDVLSVENVDPSITTTNGLTLTLGTHYTVAGSAFSMTVAGFALFNDLAVGEGDTFALNYDISDGTAAVGNTLDVTVNGSNDDPAASIIVRDVLEDGPTLVVDLLTDASASDPDASDVLTVQNVDPTVTSDSGVALTLGTHYTVVDSTFTMTAAGFALFNDLAVGGFDVVSFNYDIDDGTSAVPNNLEVLINGSNDDPTASAIVRAIGETGPLNVDLLSDAAAADPDASDVLSVQNLDGTITTVDGRVLTLGVDYTVTGSVFELTAAGLALFGDLGDAEDDTFTFNYEVTDGTAATSNTLDVTVSGGNSPPTATAIVRAVDEDGPTLAVDLLVDASASDADASDVLTVQNVETSITTTNGLTLILGTHYTVVGSAFTITAAGFAVFNELAAG